MCGVYQAHARKLWADFRKEYRTRVLEGLAIHTRLQAETSLDHFERIVKPQRVFALSTQHIDDFTAERRREPGKLARYVTGDHFAAIYQACTVARMPRHLPNATGGTGGAAYW